MTGHNERFSEPAGVCCVKGRILTLQPTAHAPGASGELDEITFRARRRGACGVAALSRTTRARSLR